eukprot:gnl/MRDRNA2_/MRDRNA2_69529_c0_seq1.p1 gnl/MRDRNA2_/MRDRNA2_69529_c0~~gnl/MRDRNA2_/MRDRNA2_69529_c0_seq1.p1  ORF type:complete len:342 (-),score=50.86 gnl/MRDRNA2_/MRDRNA2_69529_c0_seq1:58-1083(-)
MGASRSTSNLDPPCMRTCDTQCSNTCVATEKFCQSDDQCLSNVASSSPCVEKPCTPCTSAYRATEEACDTDDPCLMNVSATIRDFWKCGGCRRSQPASTALDKDEVVDEGSGMVHSIPVLDDVIHDPVLEGFWDTEVAWQRNSRSRFPRPPSQKTLALQVEAERLQIEHEQKQEADINSLMRNMLADVRAMEKEQIVAHVHHENDEMEEMPNSDGIKHSFAHNPELDEHGATRFQRFVKQTGMHQKVREGKKKNSFWSKDAGDVGSSDVEHPRRNKITDPQPSHENHHASHGVHWHPHSEKVWKHHHPRQPGKGDLHHTQPKNLPTVPDAFSFNWHDHGKK